MGRLFDVRARRGTASAWTTASPTLNAGEFGYETDTGRMKIGDGATVWTALAYHAAFTAAEPTASGLYSTVGTGAITSGGAAATYNEIWFTPIILDRPRTLTNIAVEVTVAGASTPHIGVYNDSDGQANALLLDCGAINPATTGAKEITGLSQALPAGRSWLAYQWGGTAHQVRMTSGAVGSAVSSSLANLIGAAGRMPIRTATTGLPNPAGVNNQAANQIRFFVKLT